MAIREQIILEGVNKTGKTFGKVQKDLHSMEGQIGSLTKLAGGLVAALGFQRIASSTINTIRTFEDLGATLVTVQGSAHAAAQAMDMIREFTAGTTFQLDEVSNAFITFRNAGLNPTKNMMTDLGNIAAGMGVRFDTVAQAVFNATTGEFEMLKRLGIKVKKEGDNITAIFRGVETEMKFNTENILAYLQEIGEDEFAGALEARAKTLTGAFSNLKDQVQEFQVAIGDSGLRSALTETARETTKFVKANSDLAVEIGFKATQAVYLLKDATQFLINNMEHVRGITGALIALKLAAWIKGATLAMRAFTIAIATNPIGALVTAVVALIGYLSFKNGLGRSLALVKGVVDALGKAFATFGNFLREKFKGVIDKIKQVFLDFVQAAINGYNVLADFLPLMERFEGDASDLTGVLVDMGKKGLEYVSEGFDTVTDHAQGFVDKIYDASGETIKFGNIVVDQFGEVVKSGKDAVAQYDEITAKAKKLREEQAKLTAYVDPIMKMASKNGAVAGSTGTTTDKGVNKEQKKLEDALGKRIEKIKNSLKTTEEVNRDQYNSDLKDLKDYYGERISFDENYFKLKNRLEERYEAQRQRASERRVSEQFDLISNGLNKELDLTELTKDEILELTKKSGRKALEDLSQVNEKAFKLNKAMNMASAVMNTATGVTKALAQGGIFGPFLAGAILAMGAAQLALISQQTYSGRARGGAVGAGQSYIVGEEGPELFTPGRTGGITPNNQLGRNVNIEFTVNAIDAQSFNVALAQQKDTIVGIINEAVNDTGRRSITA